MRLAFSERVLRGLGAVSAVISLTIALSPFVVVHHSDGPACVFSNSDLVAQELERLNGREAEWQLNATERLALLLEKTFLTIEPPSLAERVKLLNDPPLGLTIHTYKLPRKWETDLITKYPLCSTHQWAAEVKLPHLIRRRKALVPIHPDMADFYLVPFPSKCYFNYVAGKNRQKMNMVFSDIVAHLRKDHPWWDRSAGRDHIFIFPSGIGASMVPDWKHFMPDSVFLVAEGDRSKEYVNTWKDIIIPGVSGHHVLSKQER
eukprot:2916480-Pyramimonas_sp.AAC.1